MSARVLNTAPSVAFRLIRAVRLRWLRWQLECLRDERERFSAVHMVGPIYLRNSFLQELQLLARIRNLEES